LIVFFRRNVLIKQLITEDFYTTLAPLKKILNLSAISISLKAERARYSFTILWWTKWSFCCLWSHCWELNQIELRNQFNSIQFNFIVN